MRLRIGSLFAPLLCVVACSSSETETPGGVGGSTGEAGETSSAGTAAGDGNGESQAGQAPQSGCEAERAELERAITEKLAAAAADPKVTSEPNFTVGLETAAGYRFVYSHGDSTLTTVYESASTSKWVAASVLLDLVDQGVLALDDSPADYLPFWEADGVTLAQLLSFTSGFSKEALCFNLPSADFGACVQKAYEANVETAPAPGSEFDYSSTHLQIAGLMAVRAAGVDGFSDLFDAWQNKTGLFPTGAFDLPSRSNPRLAGGMHWTGEEYLGFLRALYHGEILEAGTRESMLESQRGDAKVVGSPTLEALGQDWAYGFGNWLECPTALGANTYDCGAGHRNSSPGAYGAYPFIDWDRHYFGILARQGELGSFRDGDSLFQVAADEISRWATVCD
jgi:CubicO group peptidase (beta-lactamase class C family)